MKQEKNSLSKASVLYITLVLLSSWILTFFFKSLNLGRNPMMAIMVVPMLLALIFLLFSEGERFSAIGWKLPRIRYWWICIFLPIFQLGMTILIGFSLGIVTFDSEHFIAHNPTPYLWINLLICIPGLFIPLILLSLPRFIIGWVNHLGEEFAWRGYLFRKLVRESGSLMKGVIISGCVWWAWHLPMFLLSPVLTQLNLWQTGLTLFTSLLAIIGAAVLYSWVYVKSGSIWAPTIIHIVWNLYRNVLTGRLADGEPGLFKGNLWLVNGEGIIGNSVVALFGFFFFLLLIRLERERNWTQFYIFQTISGERGK